MGRPPGIRRRAYPESAAKLPDEPESPQKETFPRRFPRLGSQFQTKLPKSTDPSPRELPERMSLNYPHLTETEATNRGVGNVDQTGVRFIPTVVRLQDCAMRLGKSHLRSITPLTFPEIRHVLIASLATSNFDDASGCDNNEQLSTRRGGLLLHTPSAHMDAFPRYVQPLMTSLVDDPPPHTTDDTWKQHMVHLHNTETPKKRKRSRAPRGDKKRKREEPEDDNDLIWSLEDLVQRGEHVSATRTIDMLTIGEDDACALEYLYSRHRGNMHAATMNLLIQMSAGRAAKIRKCADKRRLLEKTKAAHPTTSESWRGKYENMRISPLAANFGSADRAIYGVNITSSCGNANKVYNLTSHRDDLKGVWRSILACGKAMEAQLERNTPSHRKILLSTLVSFISNAYGLPTPEACFGTHHVLIEEVSGCMLKILEHIEMARHAQAKLRDKLFYESGDGIDTDALLKFLDSEGKQLSVQLDDAAYLYDSRENVAEWEEKAAALVDSNSADNISECTDGLLAAEALVDEAKSHGYSSKVLVQLRTRIQKAYGLRLRIQKWKESCNGDKKGTVRSVTALVRESNRVKLIFPEVSELLNFHRQVEGWVDRANVAIRSRISLGEIEELIDRGESMPLDLSDHVEKLRARVSTASEWTAALESVVPIPQAPDGNPDWLQWLQQVRKSLRNGMHGKLHDLASEGSRIPVEVDAVKLLQVELDSKNWTQKARKWSPQNSDGRRGKLAEIRDHVHKAQALRDRLSLPEAKRVAWILEGESELRDVVQAADNWYEKYKEFLEGDNRRNQSRSCLSIQKLRRIVDEANGIHANIGNAGLKINRILGQAEAWYKKHSTLLELCDEALAGTSSPRPRVDIADMAKAVSSAESDVSLDLDEALNLKKLTQSAKSWFERVDVAAPKRSKRQGRTARSKLTVGEISELIQEASRLPVDTEDGVQRLQLMLHSVETWRGEASVELTKVSACFDQLRGRLRLGFGMPKEFRLDRKFSDDGEFEDDAKRNGIGTDMEDGECEEAKNAGDIQSQSDTLSTTESESDSGAHMLLDKKNSNVHRIIKWLQKGAKSHGIVTQEAEVCELLELVSQWCLRSLKYLSSPREIFDKRYYGAFDRFIGEGQELAKKSQEEWESTYGKVSWDSLGAHWGGTVLDQLDRLEILRAEREKFIKWCGLAVQTLNDEKRLTLDRLEGLAQQSRCFPAASDMVQKIRGLSVKAKAWSEDARKVLGSGKKLSLQDAKALLETGEKLKVNSPEVRIIKASLRAAKGWTNRVKRCKLEQGSVHVSNVKDLIAEYDTFLIDMPDELARLQQATQSYCVCRRPYNGFMIGCDECEEWYHGPCIGVSESRADRFDKYVCLRCSLQNIFKNSSTSALRIVRKWTSAAEKKKARQVEYQKHQRKVRKETKDIEKFRAEIDTYNREGERCQTQPEASDHGLVVDAVASDPMEVSDKGISSVSEEEERVTGESRSKLEAAEKGLLEAEQRLMVLQRANAERKRLDNLEDWKADNLRKWCIRVRSLVLVPATDELIKRAKPLPQGEISDPMLSLITDATSLGVFGLPDVDAMVNLFKCMSWSLFALSIVRRKATLMELQTVLSKASPLKLPDEKPVRTMRVMVQRGLQWQGKVRRALAPKPGQTKPLNVDLLRSLLLAVEESAVRIPEILQLKSAIADKGTRHCICGGPHYGGFMLCCEKCELWFHGSCAKTAKDSVSLENWLCAACRGEEYPVLPENIESTYCISDAAGNGADSYNLSAEVDCSPHAPNPEQLWPPFGLKDDKTASEILGLECASYPDDIDPLPSPLSNGTKPLDSDPNSKGRKQRHLSDEGRSSGSVPAKHQIAVGVEDKNATLDRTDERGPVHNGKVSFQSTGSGREIEAVALEKSVRELEHSRIPEAISEHRRLASDCRLKSNELGHTGTSCSDVCAAGNEGADVSIQGAHSSTSAVSETEGLQVRDGGLIPPNSLRIASEELAMGATRESREAHRSDSATTREMGIEDPSSGPGTVNAGAADDSQAALGYRECTRNAGENESDLVLDVRKRGDMASGGTSDRLEPSPESTKPSSLLPSHVSSTFTDDIVSSSNTTYGGVGDAAVTGMPRNELKTDSDSGIRVPYTSCPPSKSESEITVPCAEQNVTVTPSSSVQILDTELERSDSVGPDGADDRSEECDAGCAQTNRNVCFQPAVPSSENDESQALSRPLADMRMTLKEASV